MITMPALARMRGPKRSEAVVNPRHLGELALGHLLGLELGSQPLAEGSSILDCHVGSLNHGRRSARYRTALTIPRSLLRRYPPFLPIAERPTGWHRVDGLDRKAPAEIGPQPTPGRRRSVLDGRAWPWVSSAGRPPPHQHVTCRTAATSRGSATWSNRQATSVGSATMSTPRRRASSYSSRMIGN